MLDCLVYLLIWVIVALIVIYIIEAVVGQFLTLPPPIMMLIRLLVGLLVLIAALNCLGLLNMGFPTPMRR
ncbi:hypothetical protein BH20PSE1_BH20PSE1_01030 [soil metagenome]